jgi:hypothetical protein
MNESAFGQELVAALEKTATDIAEIATLYLAQTASGHPAGSGRRRRGCSHWWGGS